MAKKCKSAKAREKTYQNPPTKLPKEVRKRQRQVQMKKK